MKTMKSLAVALIALVMLATMFAGCAQQPVSGDTGKADTSDELYIGVYCFGDLEYFYDHKIGLEAAGKMLGVQTKYTGPADGDYAAMVDAFEQAIAEQPAGIIAFGADATLTAVIDKAEEAGIHVVLVDGDLADSNRTSFVGTGSYDAGFLGGTKLAEAIGGKGQVAIMTVVDAELHQARLAGYQAALATYPDIEIVQVGDDKADPTTGAAVVSAILQEYPDLAGIGCTDATGGASSATAVAEAGKSSQVKIIAMDRDQSVLQGIVDGNVYGTLVQNTALMPMYALEILYTMNHAEVEISTDNVAAGVVAAPASINTGVVWVDSKNAAYFMRNKG